MNEVYVKLGELMIWIGVITLFPDMFHSVTNYGVVGRAVQNGLLCVKCWNPRSFSKSVHHKVDDYLYGGGEGMLMMVQPLRDAIRTAKTEAGGNVRVVYLSPQGRKLDQSGVNELLSCIKLILICGRYKGVDERLIIKEVDEEWSIGDYVLSGGELAAMVLIDAISRLIPGVLGNVLSVQDTFFNGRNILDPPHYTRPAIFEGVNVPKVLLSGNHSAINRWRLKTSLGRTWIQRPELLKQSMLTDEENILLLEFKNELLLRLKNELY